MSFKKKTNLKPIIWFTGLPGSGKTTISQLFYRLLKKKKYKKIKLIDGDKFRKKLKILDIVNSIEIRLVI